MHILITGGAGFIGARLAKRLLADGFIRLDTGTQRFTSLTLFDQVAAAGLPADPRLIIKTGDASAVTTIDDLVHQADIIFHLAAVVSVAAERDFDLGMRVNFHGTCALLERCRQHGRKPRIIFASSAAVYGGPLPAICGEETALFPQTSYGMQKVMGERLIDDYSRKGFIDGRSLRLPTIIVRPGTPNMAASAFASSLVREPLMGRSYACPVPVETPLCVLSVRRVVDSFIHAAELSPTVLGHTRAIQLPGLTMPVADLISALERVAGANVAKRISCDIQPEIVRIVQGWPVRFDIKRSAQLGFKADATPDAIISDFINDELAGQVVA